MFDYHIKIEYGRHVGKYMLKPNIDLMFNKNKTDEELKQYREAIKLEEVKIKRLGFAIVTVIDGKLVDED